MERELWAWLMVGLRDVRRSFHDSAYHTHATASVVRTYLWAVLHDRPIAWACDPRAWDRRTRPATLPSQSTMSRRLRTAAATDFLTRLGRRLRGEVGGALTLLKCIDGRPLTVARHSTDAHATLGHAHGRSARGYKRHLIDAGGPMPEAFAVTPLNVGEKATARQLIPRLTGAGYLLGDTNYHATDLFELADHHGHQLIAPRQRPHTGLGHRRQSRLRLDCIDRLEQAPPINRFATDLLRQRNQVETCFANLASFFAGLSQLPPWVRGLRRVQTYIHAKLLINAARIRELRA